MQCYGFVTQDIFAWCDAGRDRGDPGVVVCDHFVGRPLLRGGCGIDETCFVDLGELELGLLYCGAVVTAGGEVVEYWTFVRLWPW